MALQPDASSVLPSASDSGTYTPSPIETHVEGIVVAPATLQYVLEAVKKVVTLLRRDRAAGCSALDVHPGPPMAKNRKRC